MSCATCAMLQCAARCAALCIVHSADPIADPARPTHSEILHLLLGVVGHGSKIMTMTKWVGPSGVLVGLAMVIVYLVSTFKAVCNDDRGQTSECSSIGSQDRQCLLYLTTSTSATCQHQSSPHQVVISS